MDAPSFFRHRFRPAAWTAAAVLGLALGVVAQAGPQSSTPTPLPQTTIVTGVTMVNIPVLVLDHSGSPVIGLSKRNFQVSDNGRLQSVRAFDNQPRPVTLAIVVDNSEPDAVAQAHRAARVFSQMVIGSDGRAAIFVGGSEPREILPFTGDLSTIVDALRAIKVGPHFDSIGEPLSMAVMALARQPSNTTRAVLVISSQSSKGNSFSQAIMETSMNDATPIFQISPNRPKNASDVNPIDPVNAGTGVGSNRAQIPPTINTHGEFPPSEGSYANFDLGSALSDVVNAIHAHEWNYVKTSGGLSLHSSNDGDFDRKLALVGNALRSFYQLYYQPTDLSRRPELHHVDVSVQSPALKGSVAWRHTYLGYMAH